jgi:Mg/Co/Ni transporter MgtE
MTNNNKWLLPWVVAIAMFIDTLDSTIVGVAIPAIADSFHINPVDMKLYLRVIY